MSSWGHQFPRYSEFVALNNIVHFTTITAQILTSDSGLQLCLWSNFPPVKWRLRAIVDLCQLRMQHCCHLWKYLMKTRWGGEGERFRCLTRAGFMHVCQPRFFLKTHSQIRKDCQVLFFCVASKQLVEMRCYTVAASWKSWLCFLSLQLGHHLMRRNQLWRPYRWAPSQAQLTSATRPTRSSSGRTLLPLTKRKRLSCVISVEDWTSLSITCMEWYGLTSSEVLGHVCSDPRPSEDRVLQDSLLVHSIVPFFKGLGLCLKSYWRGITSSSEHPHKLILLSWTWTSTGQPSRWRAPPTCPIHWPPQH